MWCVYIVECVDKSFYTGITCDIARRVKEHNSGKGGHYTRTHLPVKLVWKEVQTDRSAALKREAQIKRLKRSEKEILIK